MATWVLVAALSLLAQGAVPMGRRGRNWNCAVVSWFCRLLRDGKAVCGGASLAIQNHSALENGGI